MIHPTTSQRLSRERTQRLRMIADKTTASPLRARARMGDIVDDFAEATGLEEYIPASAEKEERQLKEMLGGAGVEVTGGGGGPDGSETRGTGGPGSAGGQAPQKCDEGEWWNWQTGQCEPEPDPTDCPEGQIYDVEQKKCVPYEAPAERRSSGGGGVSTKKTSGTETTTTNWNVARVFGVLGATAAGATVGGVLAGGIATMAGSKRPLLWAAGGGVTGALVAGGGATIWVAMTDG